MVAAVRQWAARQAGRSDVRRIGYFGSYARGDWGGSDVDLVAVVSDESAAVPFEERSAAWSLSELPVPAELLVYTESEWTRLRDSGNRFARTLDAEIVWVAER